MKYLNKIIVFTLILQSLAFCAASEVEFFKRSEVSGTKNLPYNYRIIDKHIHAGGHPLVSFGEYNNSDEQALRLLKNLKAKGVNTVIDLIGTWQIHERYKPILKKAGMEEIFIPMHTGKLPTSAEWQKIKQAMQNPVYIHCKHGADRTGAIIARYLIEEKGYSSYEAWKAVISGGECAGPFGGLKQVAPYKNLALFFWPDASDNVEINKIYHIK